MSGLDVCPYCKTQGTGTSQYETRDLHGNGYLIKRCRVCRSYYLFPQPSAEQSSMAYADSYYGPGNNKFLGLFETILDLFRRRRARLVARYIPPGGNILDIGCGNGRFLKYVSDLRRCHLYGTELPGRSADRASRIPEISLKVGELAPDDFPEGFFDVVTLFHVFEHLAEPAAMVLTIGRLLRDNGVCVMSFPNIGSFQARLFAGNWLHLDPPRHLFFVTPAEFVRKVSGLGFVVEGTSFFSLEQNPFGMIQSILNCLSTKRDLLLEMLKGNTDYTRHVPWPVMWAHVTFFVLSFPFFVLLDLVEAFLRKGATVQFVLRKASTQVT